MSDPIHQSSKQSQARRWRSSLQDSVGTVPKVRSTPKAGGLIEPRTRSQWNRERSYFGAELQQLR